MSHSQHLTGLGASALEWKAATFTVFLQHHFVLMGHFLMSLGAVAMANHTPGADKCSWHSLKINLLWIVKLLQCLSAGSPFSASELTWLFNRHWIPPQQIDVLSCALKLFYGWLYDCFMYDYIMYYCFQPINSRNINLYYPSFKPILSDPLSHC